MLALQATTVTDICMTLSGKGEQGRRLMPTCCQLPRRGEPWWELQEKRLGDPAGGSCAQLLLHPVQPCGHQG